MNDLHEFLNPLNQFELSSDKAYSDSQFGSLITIYAEEFPDLSLSDIVLVGIDEFRGEGSNARPNSADAIRSQLYRLYNWHKDIAIADVGNIKNGQTLNDTYAAIKTVVAELLGLNKTVIIIGGSHDNTLAQYYAYKELNKIIEATIIDATIDLKSESRLKSQSFLMEMLAGEPNMVSHYNHIGFQSYFVHPRMLETMDKLRFDCYRLGKAKEQIEEMEPVLRNSDLLSFDIAAIKASDSPASNCSPNGFTGEEACSLSRYAGLSPTLTSLGIYGYNPDLDRDDLSALQIAQIIWYFIDGKNRSRQEAHLGERQNFNEYHTAFA
jgi:formiminoglutamase